MTMLTVIETIVIIGAGGGGGIATASSFIGLNQGIRKMSILQSFLWTSFRLA